MHPFGQKCQGCIFIFPISQLKPRIDLAARRLGGLTFWNAVMFPSRPRAVIINMDRHPEASWEDVAEKLADPAKAAAVAWMEETGGEPDVVALGGGWAIVDCSKEVPAGRR